MDWISNDKPENGDKWWCEFYISFILHSFHSKERTVSENIKIQLAFYFWYPQSYNGFCKAFVKKFTFFIVERVENEKMLKMKHTIYFLFSIYSHLSSIGAKFFYKKLAFLMVEQVENGTGVKWNTFFAVVKLNIN